MHLSDFARVSSAAGLADRPASTPTAFAASRCGIRDGQHRRLAAPSEAPIFVDVASKSGYAPAVAHRRLPRRCRDHVFGAGLARPPTGAKDFATARHDRIRRRPALDGLINEYREATLNPRSNQVAGFRPADDYWLLHKVGIVLLEELGTFFIREGVQPRPKNSSRGAPAPKAAAFRPRHRSRYGSHAVRPAAHAGSRPCVHRSTGRR